MICKCGSNIVIFDGEVFKCAYCREILNDVKKLEEKRR